MATISVKLQGSAPSGIDVIPVHTVGMSPPDALTGAVYPVVAVSDASNPATMPAEYVVHGPWANDMTSLATTDGSITSSLFTGGRVGTVTPIYVADGGGISTVPGMIRQLIGEFTNGATGSVIKVAAPGAGAGSVGAGIYSGTGVPGVALGADGDFYIRTTTNFIYGPKASGIWPAGISMVGPAGAAGAAGAAGTNGYSVLSGAVAPTIEGVNGDFYINIVTSMLYGPKAGGVWPAGVSLIGPTGSMPTEVSFSPQTATYTLAISDANKVITMTAVAPMLLNVPATGTVAIPVGFQCMVIQRLAAGTVAITPEVGIGISTSMPGLNMTAEGSVAYLLKVSNDNWVAWGALTA